jgi:hypothetical protein
MKSLKFKPRSIELKKNKLVSMLHAKGSLLLILLFALFLTQSCVTFNIDKFAKPISYSNKIPQLKLMRTKMNPELIYGGLTFKYREGLNMFTEEAAYQKKRKSNREIQDKLIGDNIKAAPSDSTMVELFNKDEKGDIEKIKKITYQTIKKNSLEEYIQDCDFVIQKRGIINDIDKIYQNKTSEILNIGANKGFLTYKILKYKEENTGYMLIPVLFNLCTLETSLLLGIPNDESKQTITLEVSIYDNKWNKIKSYSSTKTKSAFVAAYWGYAGRNFSTDVYRAANAKAFGAALDDILKQINDDSNKINIELNK